MAAIETLNGSKNEDQLYYESISETNLVQQLDLQIETLDDDEFHLPPITELPTLESILNEDDDDPASISDSENTINTNELRPNFSVESCDTVSVFSKESSDSKSRTSMEHKQPFTKKEVRKSTVGSILRHIALKGIASQLVSAHERVGAGLPTTMAISKVICIGTSHGLILVFEPSQALKFCLGSTQQGEQHGSVSSLAINQECTKLLAGFAKGHLCLFDLSNGKLLQNIAEAHTPFTAVLHIKWTDSPGLALISDSGGSVFELSIRRTMGMNSNESRCIFSGSRGEVCTIEPLLMGHFLSLPPVIDTLIVAMATISKLIVVSLRPHLKVLFSYPLKGSSATLPLLSWQFVIIQMPDGSKVIDPVLAFGREYDVYFYQLTHGSQDQLTFVPLQRMQVSYTLQSLSWLNSRTLAIIDISEILHVIDVKNQEELETLDLARLGLVYASPHFKALATGGNVSKAMTVAGDRACYHSMITYESQILLLGTKAFQVVTMRTWCERVDHLVKVKCIKEALYWLLEILQEKAQAVIGLTHKKPKRYQLVKEKLRQLLDVYLQCSLSERPERGSLIQLMHFYQSVVPCCVKVGVEADLKDILFTKVWDCFSDDPVARGIFLESLEPYILDDQIIDISPTITQCLLSHFEDKGHLKDAEACIIHLEVTSLDLHQTLTLCWAHGLYDAIFYVYARGMKDYVTPLEELLTILRSALDSNALLTDMQVSLGNKILVYISCCLAGRAYPRGDIGKDDIKKVKHEVFKCITTLHTKNANVEEQAFPFLRTLLRFDTREFLNVLALAFEEKEFTSELGLVQRQRVVDILLQVMVDVDGFDHSQVCSLFIFIARQISRQGRASTSKELINQVLNQLTCEESESYQDERQSALLELIQSTTLQGYDSDDLIKKAQRAQFYRVCEYLYEKTGNYEKILECYLKDKYRKIEVFTYIKNILTSSRSQDNLKQLLINQILFYAKALVNVDSLELANILLCTKTLWPLITKIGEEISNEETLLFNYLQAIFLSKSNLPSTSGNNKNKSEESKSDDTSCDAILFPHMQEKYIQLMCKLHPNQVYPYLQGAENYRINEILDFCKMADLDEATAYLLEKTGDLKGSFEIHLKILGNKIGALMSQCSEEDNKMHASLGHVQSQVMKIIKISQLGSVQANEVGRSEMWFPLLDLFLDLQPSIGTQNGLSAEVRGIISHIVNSMVPYISLPSILERIMHSPGYSDCNFGQIRHLLKDMVERYSYEETLFSTVTRIIQRDQLRYVTQMKGQAASPLPVSRAACSLCKEHYHMSTTAICFSCGHTYHERCGGDGATCVICSGPSGIRKDANVSDIRKENDNSNLEAKMDDTQIEGLKRIAVLNTNTPRLCNFEDLRTTNRLSKSTFNHETFSQEFALKLSPKTFIHYLNDV